MEAIRAAGGFATPASRASQTLVSFASAFASASTAAAAALHRPVGAKFTKGEPERPIRWRQLSVFSSFRPVEPLVPLV